MIIYYFLLNNQKVNHIIMLLFGVIRELQKYAKDILKNLIIINKSFQKLMACQLILISQHLKLNGIYI